MAAASESAIRFTPAWSSSPTALPRRRGASERVLTTDPGTGVMRHADAGYRRAIEVARVRRVRIPMLDAAERTATEPDVRRPEP
jgi:hypothetical protein